MPPADRKENANLNATANGFVRTNTPPPPPSLTAAPPTAPPPPVLNAALDTAIIFDWDDTLLASSFLSGKGYRLDNNLERPPELEAQLKELEQSVINVLTLALQYGPVHVVTNAETGWVQMSAAKFIPGVVPLLNSKVKVISARSTYEAMFPDAPLKWKFYAFQEKLASTFSEHKAEKNVISFGDSYVEREAVRAVTKGLPRTRTKSVKFAERPSMEQLRRQIELVANCLQYIYSHDGDLDLQLTVTVNSNSPPSSPSATTRPPQLAPMPALPPSDASALPLPMPLPGPLLVSTTIPTTPKTAPPSPAAPKSPLSAPHSPLRTATQSVHNLFLASATPTTPSSRPMTAPTSTSPRAQSQVQQPPVVPASAAFHNTNASVTTPRTLLSATSSSSSNSTKGSGSILGAGSGSGAGSSHSHNQSLLAGMQLQLQMQMQQQMLQMQLQQSMLKPTPMDLSLSGLGSSRAPMVQS